MKLMAFNGSPRKRWNTATLLEKAVEGAAAQAHDQVRGPGSFHQTWQGLTRLIENGMAGHICITFTEMRHNFEQIPRLMEMIDSKGIRRFVSGTLVCGGRALESGGLSPPTPQQYEELLQLFRQDPVFRERYRRIGNIAALEWDQAKTDNTDTCCTFIETPYVTAEGRLYPCVMLHADEYAASDVYTRSLTSSMAESIDSWSRLQQIKLSRITELDLCSGCRDYAKCGAGCMGRAFTAYEDYFAVEDRCRLRQAVYAQIPENT